MNIKSKIAALAVAGAMVVGGVGVAQSAQAAEIPGVITITPTSGNVNTDIHFLESMAISVGAPSGSAAAGGTFVFQGGVNMGAVSIMRTPSTPTTYGTYGLDGRASYADRLISPDHPYLTDKLLSQTDVPLATGAFELRNYYFPLSTSIDLVNDPYVKLDMTYDASTGAWGLPVDPPIATTVSLTAGETVNPGEVSLAASVKKLSDGTPATAAAGVINFKEGATTVASAPVASEAASALLTGVADGTHIYTAEFVPSDTVYAGSTSLPATVVVGAVTAPGSKTVNITTTIPSGVGTLTLSGVSSSVALGTATLSGGTLNASGTLNAVVTDSRQLDYPAWSLTGQVGNFESGSHTLNGKYLGWTPSVTGDATGSHAGAAIAPAPGTGAGLKNIRTMATGSPSAAGDITNASALLELKAPADTPAGEYAATLTLTLI